MQSLCRQCATVNPLPQLAIQRLNQMLWILVHLSKAPDSISESNFTIRLISLHLYVYHNVAKQRIGNNYPWQRIHATLGELLCRFLHGPCLVKIRYYEVEVEAMLRPTVSRPVCLGVGLPSGSHDQIFVLCLAVAGFLIWGTLSDERTGLKFTRTIASRPCSRVQVQQNSRPYFTPSYETPLTGGPGPHTDIPQEQGGPVIPSGIGFPFCRLLRLVGLRWRYSNPPPHGKKY
jgi:hypothetical protein